jgi:hypothetical protein
VIWVAILILPVALLLVLLLALLGFIVRLLDPYRRRLLPFTVAQDVAFAKPAWPGPGQLDASAPLPGAPGTNPPGTPKP